MATNLLTISEYRDYDDLPSPAENDTQIAKAITAAESFISKETGGRIFAVDPSPVTTTEILNGKNNRRLFTKNDPIQSVTTLEYWDGTQWVEYDSVTYPSTFKTNSNAIYFTQGHRFFGGYQNIRVTYVYGWTEIPEELAYATYLVAKQFILEADRQGIGGQSDGEQNFTYIHEIPKRAKEIIFRYKLGF